MNRKKRKIWTVSDIAFLKKNYHRASNPTLAKILDCSVVAIQGKRATLGLTKDFSSQEYALYKGDELLHIGTLHELAEYHGVKESTIRYYATTAYHERIAKRKGKDHILVDRLNYVDELTLQYA